MTSMARQPPIPRLTSSSVARQRCLSGDAALLINSGASSPSSARLCHPRPSSIQRRRHAPCRHSRCSRHVAPSRPRESATNRRRAPRTLARGIYVLVRREGTRLPGRACGGWRRSPSCPALQSSCRRQRGRRAQADPEARPLPRTMAVIPLPAQFPGPDEHWERQGV